ncbi:MAG: transposase [Opitutaceae bacterium]|nr:transposase [Opitutaceae bacterium]
MSTDDTLSPKESPRRVILPHTPPDFVKCGAVFFITVCALPRGIPSLTPPETWPVLRNAAVHYHRVNRWHLHLLLAMPDHVHLLVSFPEEESMHRVVAAWKHYVAGHASITWQRDFFDHRLRGDESFDEKATYIRLNPVRAKLVANESDWPCVWSAR